MKHHKTLLAALVIVVFALGLGYFAANGSLFMGALNNNRPIQNFTGPAQEGEIDHMALPDLIIEDITYEYDANNQFHIDVKNIGNQAVNNNFNSMADTFSISTSMGLLSWGGLGGIAPGETIEVTTHELGYSLPFEFCVDPQNEVIESDETNNCDTVYFFL